MANKLITQFTPIANPAGTRLITLGDETTGERFQISIADFFALVDSDATFSGQVSIVKDGTPLILDRNTTDGNAILFRLAGVAFGRIEANTDGLAIRSDLGKTLIFKTNADTIALILGTDQAPTFPSLAGTGTRNVVVDANGKMSAP